MHFPANRVGDVANGTKTLTVRVGEEMGKYQAGKTYQVSTYEGKLHPIYVQIDSVNKVPITDLDKHGVPSHISKYITKTYNPADGMVEVIKFKKVEPEIKLASNLDYLISPEKNIDTIKPLWQALEAYHDSLSNYTGEPRKFEQFKKTVTNPKVPGKLHLEVARDKNGKLAGFALTRQSYKTNPNEFINLYVNEADRGNQLGKALTTAALDYHYNKQNSKQPTHLSVAYNNKGILPLYESFGFEPSSISMMFPKAPSNSADYINKLKNELGK